MGGSINTSKLAADAAERLLAEIEKRLGLPAIDPIRIGVARIVDQLLAE